MKIKLIVELTYDENIIHGDDPIGKDWFYDDVLLYGDLILHSLEIGDTVEEIKVLEILE